VRIEGQPVTPTLVSDGNLAGFQIILSVNGKPAAIIMADRSQPTMALAADYIHSIAPDRARIGAKYAYLITTGRVTMGARHIAKQSHIHVIDGEKYEEMRARAYGWKEAIREPIYHDNTPKSVETPRHATEEEMRALLTKRDERDTHDRYARPLPNQKIPTPAPITIPAIRTPRKHHTAPLNNRVGELSPLEEAAILAWRKGDKVEAAKIILNS
jgi:hypothetical protein